MAKLAIRALQVRALLIDAEAVCRRLDLASGMEHQANGVLIRCPAHPDKKPSCSVTRGPDGTLRAKCFACEWTADAIGLVAKCRGLSTNGDGFRETLATCAEVAGNLVLADEIRGGSSQATPRVIPKPPTPSTTPKSYPNPEELRALFNDGIRADDDRAACAMLVKRLIDPVLVSESQLAVSLREGQRLPTWASYRGKSWHATGHTLILPTFDATGTARSVRAWRVVDGDSPKRLPPAGKKAAGLVLANHPAAEMLAGRREPARVIIVEGEPDFLTWGTCSPDLAIIGIGSGSWTQDHANQIPDDTQVDIRTHCDAAGDKYAAHIVKTLGDRVPVWRLSA